MASSKKRAPAPKKTREEADIDDDLDALFTKPLSEFTEARDDLAKSLRQAGDREGAARVKAIRKPSVSAWALNQIARRYPQRMDALLEAGEKLREAQRGALEAGGAKGLREASQAHRALVNELLRAAPSLFSESGFRAAGGNMDRVRDSLLAAPTARREDLERLERGRLTQELEPGDLSDVLGLMRGRPAPRPVEEPRARAKPAAPAIEAPPKAEKPAAPVKAEKPKRKAAAKAQKPERKAASLPREKARTTDREEKKKLAADAREEKKRLAREQRDEKKRLAQEQRDEKKRLAADAREEKKRLAGARKERAEASREAARTAKEAERRSAEADRLMRAAEEAEAAAKAAMDRARDAEREAREAQKLAEEAARRLEAAEGNLEA
jgi:hypothetical protein